MKTARTRKISPSAQGELTYEIGVCQGQVLIRIAENVGGGYFSPEWVRWSAIQDCLSTELRAGRAFPSAVFKSAFVNRSTNNSAFLAAALRSEGVLIPAPEQATQHCLSDDWTAWEQRVLAGLEPERQEDKPATASAASGKAGKSGKKPRHTTDAAPP